MTAEEIIHMLQNKAREHLEKAYMLEIKAVERARVDLPTGATYRLARKNRAKFSALADMADEIQAKLMHEEAKS